MNSKELQKTVRRIKHAKIKNIGELLTSKKMKLSRMPFNIWLKSVDNNLPIVSLFPMPPMLQQVLINYLSNKKFAKPKTTLFSHTQLIGPVQVKIDNTRYHSLFHVNYTNKILDN
ncbi:hypothetical protein L3081_23540 [Colwellia sp. MSW7]|uniref:Uncharacterized protein n=1 Tax=Colwellia maritima TaxID=2912588 RepID=A0ABS9X6E1_9GAMM|nr:hypothetical protein [Colwellia maritima]MCI2285808.1 hypothetical protein [Colwellia maritima]